MNTEIKRFLLVDDDALNNILSKMVLKKNCIGAYVTDFIYPELALEYIQMEYVQNNFIEKTTLLLDINMPSINGWEFLEKFQAFDESIKNQFEIYILSSSIDPADIERAKINSLVIDFIEKPLSRNTVLKL